MIKKISGRFFICTLYMFLTKNKIEQGHGNRIMGASMKKDFTILLLFMYRNGKPIIKLCTKGVMYGHYIRDT